MIWTVITQRCKFSNGGVVETNVHQLHGPMDGSAAMALASERLLTDPTTASCNTFIKIVALVKGDHVKSTVVNDLV